MVALAENATLFSPALADWRGRRWSDLALWAASLIFVLFGTGALVLIVLFIAAEALPVLKQPGGLRGLLFGLPWEPLADPPSYGILHAWLSSLMVTALALLLAVPVALGVAIFTSEIAPPMLRGLLQPCMELLAGIPSVVYGFFGYVTLIPLFENSFGLSAGECILAAGLILAVMVLPFVAGTATEALRGVSGNLRRQRHGRAAIAHGSRPAHHGVDPDRTGRSRGGFGQIPCPDGGGPDPHGHHGRHQPGRTGLETQDVAPPCLKSRSARRRPWLAWVIASPPCWSG